METRMQIRRLSNALGASVGGVDLNALTQDQVQDIKQAFRDHLVLVFPGQKDLSPGEQIQFAQNFGELDDNKAIPFYRHPEWKEIMLITNRKIGGKESQTQDTGRLWHSDHSFSTRPDKATMLHCIEVPEVGGTTMFTNMYKAFGTLSAGLQNLLRPMEAVHSVTHYVQKNPFFAKRDPAQTAELERLSPPVAQPVVRIHSETGKPALYISEGQTSRFVGMTVAESEGLLEYLFRHSVMPEFTYRHQWSVGDLLMWDNRCTLHLALKDYTHDQKRHMHRITVLGEPCGRLLQNED
jgi:taurine dioxygenase